MIVRVQYSIKAVVYLCVRSILPLYTFFPVLFWNCSDSGLFLFYFGTVRTVSVLCMIRKFIKIGLSTDVQNTQGRSWKQYRRTWCVSWNYINCIEFIPPRYSKHWPKIVVLVKASSCCK